MIGFFFFFFGGGGGGGCRATLGEWNNMQETLKTYERASEQQLIIGRRCCCFSARIAKLKLGHIAYPQLA
jgi:hypothetical protein